MNRLRKQYLVEKAKAHALLNKFVEGVSDSYYSDIDTFCHGEDYNSKTKQLLEDFAIYLFSSKTIPIKGEE